MVDNKVYKTNYECPLCGQTIISDGFEFYCTGLDCKFDKTAGELFEYYANNEKLEKIDGDL